MSVQQQYEAWLHGFTKYLDKTANKVALFTYLKQKVRGDEADLAPVIFLPVMESLLVDSVISLAKLYEQRSDRNLNEFLKFVETNLGNLVWTRGSITQQQIDAQRQSIASKQTAVKNILAQRNKYFAHHDEEFFVDADKLEEVYPLSIDDVEELVRTAQGINNAHNLALSGSIPVTLHEFYVVALDNMFNKLRERPNERNVG